MDPIERLAHDFITATGAGDLEAVAAMYAPDAVIWINATGTEMAAADGVAVLASLHRRAAAVRYEVLEVIPTARGYVQRHVLHVTVPARDGHPAQDLADHVLGKIPPDDLAALRAAFPDFINGPHRPPHPRPTGRPESHQQANLT